MRGLGCIGWQGHTEQSWLVSEPTLLSLSLWKEALFGTVACEQMSHTQVPALPPNNAVPLGKRLNLSASFVKQDKNNSDTYFFWL